MQVVITFEEPGARGGYERLEECGGAGIGGQTEARCAQVGKEAFQETNLGGAACQSGGLGSGDSVYEMSGEGSGDVLRARRMADF